MMRHQLFWDGNKRIAMICANYELIMAGCGMLNINENQLETWHIYIFNFNGKNINDNDFKHFNPIFYHQTVIFSRLH
ncbi:hypothetical protein D6D59_02580 [Moraxella catarrhalis]|nr:hypothetical protein D6D59_02580 [Moraxella catarrhalis]